MFDCTIVDYLLPGEDGLAGISALRKSFPSMAIIMATSHGNQEIATEAMKRGASDYVRKADITAQSLRRSIATYVNNPFLSKWVMQEQQDLYDVLCYGPPTSVSSATAASNSSGRNNFANSSVSALLKPPSLSLQNGETGKEIAFRSTA
jgi:DNA-binding NarL/FixJ family response regulator